ncbi:MAG: hypothetical protein OSB73_21060 [Candidatus Latescibacteria bacterium]|nr:hypothetical protein [Candidatus Latescibacterota bacterium]
MLKPKYSLNLRFTDVRLGKALAHDPPQTSGDRPIPNGHEANRNSSPRATIAFAKVARTGYKLAVITEAVQKKEKAPSQLSLAGGFYRAVSTESLSLQRRTAHHPQQSSLNKIDPVAK